MWSCYITSVLILILFHFSNIYVSQSGQFWFGKFIDKYRDVTESLTKTRHNHGNFSVLKN